MTFSLTFKETVPIINIIPNKTKVKQKALPARFVKCLAATQENTRTFAVMMSILERLQAQNLHLSCKENSFSKTLF